MPPARPAIHLPTGIQGIAASLFSRPQLISETHFDAGQVQTNNQIIRFQRILVYSNVKSVVSLHKSSWRTVSHSG